MKWELIVNGHATNLNDGSLCYLESYDGLGMAPLHRIIRRGALQHGESDVGYRLDPRQVKLVLGINGTSIMDKYARRATLISMLRPRTNTVSLRWTYDDGTVRQLDVLYFGNMTMPVRSGDGFYESIGLTLVAHDPTLYDPAPGGLDYTINAGSDVFAVPTAVATKVGADTINKSKTTVYPGSWLTFPIVTINGPLTGPVVTNKTTGEKLDFTGIVISSGTTYTINCLYGKKTVTDQSGVNHIADLTPDSNLATFHIAPDDEAPGGNNEISVSGTAANALTSVHLSWINRYIGI